MTLLEVHVWPWRFRALEPIHFGHAANTLRGALGYAVADSPEYSRWFRPELPRGSGPSGFADPPRPFVLRATHLDGAFVPVGEVFQFHIHSFQTREDRFGLVRDALARASAAGLGPTRGRAQLLPATPEASVRVSLEPTDEPVSRIRVHFLTPTELKGGPLDDFGTLFARARDRVASLRAQYGDGPLDIDFKRLGERARTIRTTGAALQTRDSQRTSSRTGQTHTLGGQTGYVDFEGDLREFLPWLEAAAWTGVGRQTVWGKGAIRIDRSLSA